MILGFLAGGAYFSTQAFLTGSVAAAPIFIGFALLSAALSVCRNTKLYNPLFGILFLLCSAMAIAIHQHLMMLYVVVCLFAIELTSKKTAILWVGASIACVIIIELSRAINAQNIQDAAMNGLLTLFMSGFAFLRKEAEQQKHKAQSLSEELTHKNLQLSLYAKEREQQSRIEERHRISRELHDSLGHALTTSIVQLEAAEKYLHKDTNKTMSIINTAKSLLIKGLDETRNIVQLLKDQDEDQELSVAINTLAQDFEQITGLSIVVEIYGNIDELSASIKQHLYRITQEALTNIIRHANATEASITLELDQHLKLSISDNGSNLEASESETLPTVKSIQSRVNELNGTLNFYRENGLTQLEITIPLAPNSETSNEH